jgi:hypothetical protein
MTEAGGRAATMVICDLILPEKVWQTLTERIRSMLLGLGREDGGIDWQGEGIAVGAASLAFVHVPFQGLGFGPSSEEAGRP